MTTYSFQEFESRTISYDLTDRDKDYLFNLQSTYRKPFNYFSVREGTHFQFNSYIGVLELESARINILPKFNNGFYNVLEMLLFIEEIPLAIDKNTKAGFDENSLVEMLVSIFVREADKVLQTGLFKEYVYESDNLSVLRGRIHIREHMKTNIYQQNRIYCEYDELETNVIENQAIRSALEVARKFNLSKALMKQVNRLFYEFSMVADRLPNNTWPEFHYNRLNQYYVTAHKLSYYIWKQMYINQIYEFNHQSHFSFLMDMNELFEEFITQLLKKYLPRSMTVKAQRTFKKAIMKNDSVYREIKPDILLESVDKPVIVIDTKYKPYGKNKVMNSDIYQLSFYSQFFMNSEDTFKAVIIYPRYIGEEMETETIHVLPGTIHEGSLHVKPVSIEKVLDLYRKKEVNNLQEIALGLI